MAPPARRARRHAHVTPRRGIHAVDEFRTRFDGGLGEVPDRANPATDAVAGIDHHDSGPALRQGPGCAHPGHPHADYDNISALDVLEHQAFPKWCTVFALLRLRYRQLNGVAPTT